MLRHVGRTHRVNDQINCMGGLSVPHAAWDAAAVHGVHAMYSVSKLGTARGPTRRGAFGCAN